MDPLTVFRMERAMGIEPTLRAWEAPVLPLNYARDIYRGRNILQIPDDIIYFFTMAVFSLAG